jgi:AcrR family transcriptional regulator
MATRRKDKKIRDAEATKKKLIECVGEIVRNAGFHAIGVNKIAQLAENDKGVIRYHFGGLAALLRAYIEDRDYWPPFFERYKLDEMSEQGEVKQLFTSLMQENLRQFYGNREMQKIILWQITQSSALLRDLSEKREDEGEKLFRMTEQTFLHSGISFKAIIALLLGGSYFAVLQSQSIKSRVCGIDLNWEHDFEIFNNTIAQVIGWAWEKANEHNKSSNMPMNYELEVLEKRVEYLCADPDSLKDGLDKELDLEVTRIEHVLGAQLLALTNETQIVTFLQFYLPKLAKLSDRLYAAESGNFVNTGRIISIIEAIRTPAVQYIPETLALPKIFRDTESKRFEFWWSTVAKPLMVKGIDTKLVEMMAVPIEQFGRSEKEVWYDFKYIKRYLSVLTEMVEGEFSESMLLETLIGLGFNHSRFSAYLGNWINSGLPGSDMEARQVLRGHKTRLAQVNIYTQRHFDRRKMPIIQEMEKWLDAKLAGLEKTEIGANPYKFSSSFKGAELSFWHKLQYDHGVFEENNLDEFSEKIAYNFSTKSKDDLSPTSIKSKFYPKDKLILKPIEELLLGMLEDVRKFL